MPRKKLSRKRNYVAVKYISVDVMKPRLLVLNNTWAQSERDSGSEESKLETDDIRRTELRGLPLVRGHRVIYDERQRQAKLIRDRDGKIVYPEPMPSNLHSRLDSRSIKFRQGFRNYPIMPHGGGYIPARTKY